ncbi:hypothetical protein AK812_SmicGene28752 [Symbiodinium microadriaticum]|uniref:Uncharacterized protein n=1 Tax=Symbiodinium microadriaticum TaxID=2951 RepID=A0A1Q9D3J2_SYMMI|nr:hypothetical protein AK812_SmicGene28752 [Symbiodinium microadriaticum]
MPNDLPGKCGNSPLRPKNSGLVSASLASPAGPLVGEPSVVPQYLSLARLMRDEGGRALQEASAKARRQAVAILRFWKLQVEIARRRAAQAAECRATILSCRGRMLAQLCIMAWRLFHHALQMCREAEALRQWGRSEAG